MADESLHTLPLENNIDYHIVTLFERLEALRKDSQGTVINNRLSSTLQPKRTMQAEIRTMEFWRWVYNHNWLNTKMKHIKNDFEFLNHYAAFNGRNVRGNFKNSREKYIA